MYICCMSKLKLVCGDWRDNIPREAIDLLILDPPFDYDYDNFLTLDASVIAVFGRGIYPYKYILLKSEQGYGYHNIVNLTPANGVNAPTLPSNTHELIHILRKGKCYFDHEFANKILEKTGKKAASVLNFGRPTTGAGYYKYSKSKYVMAYLMAYVPQGAFVYDPCCGISSAAYGCSLRNNRYFGVDIDKDILHKVERQDLFFTM